MATSNIEIAQQAELWPITRIAEGLGIPDEELEPYGRFKAKVSLRHLRTLQEKPRGRLVLMTAVSPTPAGEGKTTTTVGLGDALTRIGERAMICLREPALGPVFGMKGGAAGGGYAQVVPMEDINLHFTGDFSAIAIATNLLAALIDNHVHHGNALGIDVRRVTWRRVLDVNDRALRDAVIGLGGPSNGYPREDGFDIVVASEVMAIFCLATDLADLKERLGEIVVAYTRDRTPIRARDLQAHGAMAAILRDALAPNLVQTLEHTPAFVHGGPFANIAHGCNSYLATDSALRMADYVVTEAGFGADLGAEKFVDILCRTTGLRPDVAVVVATVRAMKFHGGVEVQDLPHENVAALEHGTANLLRHLKTLRETWGIPTVVAINHRAEDTDAETAALVAAAESVGVTAVVAKHFAEGGAGAEELAREVVRLCDERAAGPEDAQALHFTYPDDATLWRKMNAIATRVYGASEITASTAVRAQIKRLQDEGYGGYPVCVAKTQYSFSTDPKLRGAPTGHVVDIREVRLAAGARFVVMICGDIMTMPGLPVTPAANSIDVDDEGRIVGLF
ncbi:MULTISPECIES: formate--tetrahydrofolate ligase [unclassified Microbacterium]|uniref:formate--tetrahydrofolate ligase n=1 Tax=unclassified Microbacterium TaxID=2609290 RepID=UPI0006F6FE4B|nr:MULTISPECIES: formate--tetrahydrofolate ligase [unclassified Microbacterium]KQP73867.1 formate--tetrahydrofolate ligase [Microbacterium sp. Leaf288]MDT0142283.1 formate--tetrahydrofolate ligase [Microbacterium sp. PRC9]